MVPIYQSCSGNDREYVNVIVCWVDYEWTANGKCYIYKLYLNLGDEDLNE